MQQTIKGPPLADFVGKSSPGLSGTTRPLEPRWPLCVAHAPATVSPKIVLFHGAAPLPETFDFALVMERVQGVTLDVLAVTPPHGLDCRQRCKIIKDFCCALAYLRSQEPQLVHGTPKIPMPLLRLHKIGASMSS